MDYTFIAVINVCILFQVAQEIWVCEKQKVTKWEGNIFSFKKALTKKMEKTREKLSK